MKARATWLALTTLVLLSGCGRHLGVRPAPVVYGPGQVDYASSVSEPKRTNEVVVYYATNRSAKGPADNRKYTNGMDKKLHLGAATVRIGDEKTDWSKIASAINDKGDNPKFALKRARELDEAAFVEAINKQLAESANKEVNIYAHGFHTDFKQETEALAKFSHYMLRRGAFVVFAWPARQRLILYNADGRRGVDSAEHLTDLVEIIAKKTDAQHINLLAYSAGGPIVSKALVVLRNRHASEDTAKLAKDLKIGNVVMAACDLDLKSFVKDQIFAVRDLTQNLIIYTCKDDMALKIASMGFGGSKIGRPNVKELKLTKEEVERAAANQRLQLIDVTDVPGPHDSGGFGGHGYWYSNSWVMTDVLTTLRWQIPAEERGLYRREKSARWYFPKDYPEKVTAAVRKLATTRPAETTSTGD